MERNSSFKVEDLSRLKDEFLSIASHELRTPGTSTNAYTQLAQKLIRENDLSTSEEYLDIADQRFCELCVALDRSDRRAQLVGSDGEELVFQAGEVFHLAARVNLLGVELGVFDCQRGALGEDLRSEEHTSELQSQSNLVCR